LEWLILDYLDLEAVNSSKMSVPTTNQHGIISKKTVRTSYITSEILSTFLKSYQQQAIYSVLTPYYTMKFSVKMSSSSWTEVQRGAKIAWLV
jgi:hypothetical protein